MYPVHLMVDRHVHFHSKLIFEYLLLTHNIRYVNSRNGPTPPESKQVGG